MDDTAVPTLRERFYEGAAFAEVIGRPKDNAVLWEALYKKASVSADVAARLKNTRGHWHLLVLNEDWCGDSVNILPYVARLADSHPGIELRVLGRDANPDLMNAHLTGKSKSIPVVIVYDEDFNEIGWWGPRPRELQKWVIEEGLALPKPDRYRHIRTWYARDHGATIVSEILSIIEKRISENETATG
ncbi:MAG: thioredoxin family protein [Gemmatimonadaceae bacterium]